MNFVLRNFDFLVKVCISTLITFVLFTFSVCILSWCGLNFEEEPLVVESETTFNTVLVIEGASYKPAKLGYSALNKINKGLGKMFGGSNEEYITKLKMDNKTIVSNEQYIYEDAKSKVGAKVFCKVSLVVYENGKREYVISEYDYY